MHGPKWRRRPAARSHSWRPLPGIYRFPPEVWRYLLPLIHFLEADQGNGVIVDELFNGGHKAAHDGFHHTRGSHRVTAVSADKPQHPLDDLKAQNIDVRIHAVDFPHVQGHVPVKNLSN